MTHESKQGVYDTIFGILDKLADDWEYTEEITPETNLIGDLGLESIDIVVLATSIQNHYQKPLPFAQFFAEIGQRKIRDVCIDEFADFIHQNLNSTVTSEVITCLESGR
jgi:acyl carrier protein